MSINFHPDFRVLPLWLAALSVFAAPGENAVSMRIPAPVYSEVGAAHGVEVVVPDAHGRATTGKFKVARIMDAQIFGQMNEADAKFVQAAGEASIAISGEVMRVVFDCPLPPDVALSAPASPWWGDRVSFTVRPDLATDEIRHFVAGAGGPTAAHRCWGKTIDRSWRHHTSMQVTTNASRYTVAMTIPLVDAFGRVPAPGDFFGVNFQRMGPTAGGNSAWAVNGGAFNTETIAHGMMVFGGAGAYFEHRLAALEERWAGRRPDAAAQAAAQRMIAPVRAALAAHGGEARSFASLERMFAQLERALVAVGRNGDALLLFRPEDAWGNALEPKLESRPLAGLSLRAPRNSRAVRAFALANLGADPFAGCLKAFDRDWWYFQWQNSDGAAGTNGLVRHVRIRRGARIFTRERRALYDPLVDLTAGSFVEIAPGDTAPFYLELDTRGLAPGTYDGWLKVQSCAPGFSDRQVPLHVEVTADDLDTVRTWRYAYTHVAETFKPGKTPAVNVLRELVRRGYNTVLLSRCDFYPWRDAAGKWHEGACADVDRYLDAWAAAGLDRAEMRLLVYLGVERDKGDTWYGLRDQAKRRLPFGSPEYDEGLRFMVSSLSRRFRERHGVDAARILWYPVDEALGRFPDPTLASPASRSAHASRVIKEMDGGVHRIYSDPMWNFLESKDFRAAARDYLRHVDVLVPSRPQLTAEVVDLLKANGAKELWCYHVTERDCAPHFYRVCAWQNLRDGMRPIVAWWNLDECTGFNYRAAHAYASYYIDFDRDEIAASRRQLAADLAFEEGRLVDYLRRRYAADPERLARIDSLVRDGANGGTMAALDAARDALAAMLDGQTNETVTGKVK